MTKLRYLGLRKLKEAKPVMHVKQVLSRWLEQRTVIGHALRVTALVRVLEALVQGSKATLSALGRSRAGTAQVKHHIRRWIRCLEPASASGVRGGIPRDRADAAIWRAKAGADG